MAFVRGAKIKGMGSYRPIATFDQGWAKRERDISVIIIHDDFNDTPGTFLDAHAITPINIPATIWTYTDPSDSVRTDGSRMFNVGASPYQPTVDAGVDDIIGSFVFQKNTAGETGTISYLVRYQDDNNSWVMRASVSGDKLFLLEQVAGGFVNRSSTSVTISAQTDYTLNVSARGTTLAMDLNGLNQLSYISSLYQGNTKFGVMFGGADYEVGDFKVIV